MIDASEKINSLVGRGGRELYDSDFAVSDAIVRELLVVGEAARQVSIDFKQSHDYIPWKEVIGMRDWLVHGYEDIDWGRVWNTAVNDVPELMASVAKIVEKTSGYK
jgi:uncharacterized protein with HEPN domain